MSVRFQIAPWLIILIPFLILAYWYDSLANTVMIARSLFGDEAVVAPKSLFTVFRVPLIEVVCAGVIEVMRRRAGGANSKTVAKYYLFWTILLYTVALKSFLQTIEAVSPTDSSDYFYYLTLAIVVIGIVAAGIAGRKLLSNLKDITGKFNRLELAALALLLIAYLGLAFVPLYIFG